MAATLFVPMHLNSGTPSLNIWERRLTTIALKVWLGHGAGRVAHVLFANKSLLSQSSPELLVIHVVHVHCIYYVFILLSLLQLLVIAWVMSLVQNPFVFAWHYSLLRIICYMCQTMLPLCDMYDVMLFLYGVKPAFVLHDIILIAYNLLNVFKLCCLFVTCMMWCCSLWCESCWSVPFKSDLRW